jgi:CBS domain-containing protein
MRVAEVMRTELRTIRSSAKVSEAIAALVEARISSLPVIEAERPIGVVSQQDVLRAAIERDADGRPRWAAERTPVVAIMSPWPPAVAADTAVAEAARTMLYLDLKRVFVVDDGALVGVLSQADIADAVATARL